MAQQLNSDSGSVTQTHNEKSDPNDTCPVCLDAFTESKPPVTLNKCKHKFCQTCLDAAMKHKPMCPLCKEFYGEMKGNQPEGTMTVTTARFPSVAGYEGSGLITIIYEFPNGIQGPNHPNPGKTYVGTKRTAYLPNNSEGKRIAGLLKKAFDAGLVFTVGESMTTGSKNAVTWNDIHHKTSMTGGQERFGYPDPTYLGRVTEELAAKGIQ